MKSPIKYWRLVALAIMLIYLGIPVVAADQKYDYQRYITIKNDFDFPIYPVIQVPDDNCVGGSKSVRRIIVNGKMAHLMV